MEKRPTSITVIAWILIVASGISLITIPVSLSDTKSKEMMMALSPIPITIQYILMFAGLLVIMVSGIGMLKRQNWARLLYIIWGMTGLTVSLITSPVKIILIPGIIFFGIVVFFLSRPGANQYFQGNT